MYLYSKLFNQFESKNGLRIFIGIFNNLKTELVVLRNVFELPVHKFSTYNVPKILLHINFGA